MKSGEHSSRCCSRRRLKRELHVDNARKNQCFERSDDRSLLNIERGNHADPHVWATRRTPRRIRGLKESAGPIGVPHIAAA